MKPSLSELMGGAAMTLATGVLPHLETAAPYIRGNVATVMMMLSLAAQEAETAAARLVRANTARAALLQRALTDAPVPDDLAAAMRATLAAPTAGLGLTELGDRLGQLNKAMISLHAWTETAAWPGAAALEAAIWDELRAGAEAAAVQLPPM
jgi:hypothetical protein